MSKILGTRLSQLLKERRMTQKAFAKKVNITETTLVHYISGKREPRAGTLADIATILGTTSDYLLGLENRDEFCFPKIVNRIRENADKLTDREKKALILALFGDE